MLIIGMDFDTKDNDLCQAHCIMHIQWTDFGKKVQ